MYIWEDNVGYSEEETAQGSGSDEKYQKAIEKVIEIGSQIEEGGRQGVDFSEEESLLWGAKLMLEGEGYASANELIEQCSAMVSKKLRQFNYLNNAIIKAKNQIARAYENGGDIEEANKLLEQAQNCLEEGNYKTGISYALKSVNSAFDEISKHESWRVEADAWKE